DPLMEQLIVARPVDEPPLVAVHAAMRATLETILATDAEALRARTRLVLSTPALRSRLWMAQESTRELFAGALARRAGLAEPDLATYARAGAALAANGVALEAWAGGADADLIALLDTAFAAING